MSVEDARGGLERLHVSEKKEAGAAPPFLASLTDEEIRAIWGEQKGFHPDPVKFARAVMARIRNSIDCA